MDPKILPFPTIGEQDLLSELFSDLATAIYAKPEKQNSMLSSIQRADKYKGFNSTYWTSDTLPATLNDTVTFYLQQPITEQDRKQFLSIYQVPFMGTGKRLKELYDINPAVFTPVLDALIQSKRIQRIISQPNTLTSIQYWLGLRKRILQENAMADFEAEAATIRSSLIKKYDEQEVVIANAFTKAQEKEPKFLASEESMQAKLAANSVRRKRKSRRGGKQGIRKLSRSNRRR